MTSRAQPSVLVNYWYAQPVGHAIEALRYCLGYRASYPDGRIGLVLNQSTPVELVSCCPFIDEVYAVPFTGFLDERSDPLAALAGLPRHWDYVVNNHRVTEAGHQRHAGFRRFFSQEEVQRIAAACPTVLDWFDRPLLDQLAVVETSDLYLSPHTGFGFAAVGTPWLALSGGPWHEMFFNGVPFHSLVPDTAKYPCFTWGSPLPLIGADEDGEGPRTPSMTAARIREDLPELLEAATSLIEQRVPYDQALGSYFRRLLVAYNGDRSRIFSFEDLHVDYV